MTGLRKFRVNARVLAIRFDYVVHRFETRRGGVMLFEPLPGDFFRNSRGTGLNLPAHEIAREFARRTGLAPHDDGAIAGGGFWRNLVFGGPRLTSVWAASERPTKPPL